MVKSDRKWFSATLTIGVGYISMPSDTIKETLMNMTKSRQFSVTITLLLCLLTPHTLFAPPMGRPALRPPVTYRPPSTSLYTRTSPLPSADLYRSWGDLRSATAVDQWNTSYWGASDTLRFRGQYDRNDPEDAASSAWLRAYESGLLADPTAPHLGLMRLRGGSEALNAGVSDSRRIAREREFVRRAFLRQAGITDRATLGDLEAALGGAFVDTVNEYLFLGTTPHRLRPEVAPGIKNPQRPTLAQRKKVATYIEMFRGLGLDGYHKAKAAFVDGRLDEASALTGIPFHVLAASYDTIDPLPLTSIQDAPVLVDVDHAPSLAARPPPASTDNSPPIEETRPYEPAVRQETYAIEATTVPFAFSGYMIGGAVVVVLGGVAFAAHAFGLFGTKAR
jgi:hypothetical protein